jgi:hypothetical protein
MLAGNKTSCFHIGMATENRYEHMSSDEDASRRAAECIVSLVIRNVELTNEWENFFGAFMTNPDLSTEGLSTNDKRFVSLAHSEAILNGATIMIEYIGISPPQGYRRWSSFIEASRQMAHDLQVITTENAVTE